MLFDMLCCTAVPNKLSFHFNNWVQIYPVLRETVAVLKGAQDVKHMEWCINGIVLAFR